MHMSTRFIIDEVLPIHEIMVEEKEGDNPLQQGIANKYNINAQITNS